MSGPLGRAIEAMRVSATTPNGQVTGEVTGWYDVRITFAPGYPERVGEAELAAQVQRLARLLFAARMAAYNHLVEEHLVRDRVAGVRRLKNLHYVVGSGSLP